MRILINTANLYVGGGLQVALSFINELSNIKSIHEFHIFISPAINEQIAITEFTGNFTFYIIEKSPASLKSRMNVTSILTRHEEKINPDIVFTVFGPSYWRPRAPHLVGFADGWVYNPDTVAYGRLPYASRARMRLSSKYKAYRILKDADYFIVETNDAKNKFSSVIGVDYRNIFVVGNTTSSIYDSQECLCKSNKYYIQLPDKEINEFRLVYISNNYPHKNLGVINQLHSLLKGYNVKFILTLEKKSFDSLNLNKAVNIINLGVVHQKSCPSIYYQSDALFSPTLLETFSASYPEAMKMRLPILTSNYSFAVDICGDAALYFDPLNPIDISNKIKQLIKNRNLRTELIQKGVERVKQFGSARSRAKKYLTLCEHVYNIKNELN